MIPVMQTPAVKVDFVGLSPLLALFGGAVLVLLVGLAKNRFTVKNVVPFLSLTSFAGAIGCTLWRLNHNKDLVEGALRFDALTYSVTLIVAVAGIAATLIAWQHRDHDTKARGEFFALMLLAAGGMVTLGAAQNLVTLFVGLELTSVPLYVLCAIEIQRKQALEAGFKYLIPGSVGAALFAYGLAFIYGATGSTDLGGIAHAIANNDSLIHDPLLLAGVGLTIVGLAFKASIAPFHQWTPDVYQGAPTPVTAFMAVATKAAVFAVAIRVFVVALPDLQLDSSPVFAALATLAIFVGNTGALLQHSLKRMLAYSSIAQAGYILVGLVVFSKLGVEATVLYILAYAPMTLAAFAVAAALERKHGNDEIQNLAGFGKSHPALAWPLSVALLGLAGIPATVGFIGKLQLIRAAVAGEYAWLAVMIVLGSAISLVYYLRTIVTVWGSENPTAEIGQTPRHQGALIFVALLCGAAIIGFGVLPQPLLDLAHDAGKAFQGVLA